MVMCRIEMGRGHPPFDHDIATDGLAPRWWRWSETVMTRRRGMLIEDFVADWRVLPLGYPARFGGRQILLALPDYRLFLLPPHSIFPVQDDNEAQEGAQAFLDALIARLAVAPRLL